MEYFAASFLTTEYENQEETSVFAGALVDLKAESKMSSVKISTCIDTFMLDVCRAADKVSNHIVVYFHDLAIYGSYIMNWLLSSNSYKLDAYECYNSKGEVSMRKFDPETTFKMQNNTYRYTISDMGEWYSIRLRHRGHFIEFKDSMKLIPCKLEELPDEFDTLHKIHNVKINRNRKPGGHLEPIECKYLANEVLIIKEVLNAMHEEGHTNTTIGSCCMKEYKSIFKEAHGDMWKEFFPNVFETTEGKWIQKTYKGGWCYVKPEHAGKTIEHEGVTADVNSEYPYVMHSVSGNRYPVGRGIYFQGSIPELAKQPDMYYFVHVRTRFYLKKGMLPTLQIKGSPFYPQREWLETSNVIDCRLPKEERFKLENRWAEHRDLNGNIVAARPDLYLTQTDWEMLQEHYDLADTEIVDGYYYRTRIGLFDEYIDKYMDMKQTSTGAKRKIAKLFANNLYGQFAKRPDNPYMICYLNDNQEMHMYPVDAHDTKPGYIPIGSAITSYARKYIIDKAQKNFDTFCYADTDSIHCMCSPDELIDVPEDPKKLGYFKYEATWDKAKFVRPKTYVEHVTEENRKPVDPYYNVKCAGMNPQVKRLFEYSLTECPKDVYEELDEAEKTFVDTKRTMDDFKIGLTIPGMLKAKKIKGGTIYVKSWYTMKKNLDF